ncbi:hypothetical protein B0H19DRAFT_92967 [Mycena capillaripes]|nr:hypothetical protein B0H19DRAFT_92967 [Mycena capillaripes]
MLPTIDSTQNSSRIHAPDAPGARTPLLHGSSKAHPPLYCSGDHAPPDHDREQLSRRASYRSFGGIERNRYERPAAHLRVSLTLENSGSVARDHLASERTFLAYVRTSLTIASAAVALAQLLSLSERLGDQMLAPLQPFETYARPIAVLSILLALYVLFVGVSRYFTIQESLTQGKFPATRFRIGIIALGFGAIISSVFGLLLAERAMGK